MQCRSSDCVLTGLELWLLVDRRLSLCMQLLAYIMLCLSFVIHLSSGALCPQRGVTQLPCLLYSQEVEDSGPQLLCENVKTHFKRSAVNKCA